MYLYDTGAELTTRTVVVVNYRWIVQQLRWRKIESPNNERVDSFSASDSDSDSEEEVDSALETMNMIRPIRLGRVRTLTSRMADFLQAGMAGM